MPATPDRMMLVQEEFRRVVAGPLSSVESRYGDAARDTKGELIETFFHSISDAQIFANERLTLMSRDAARLDLAVSGEASVLAIALSDDVMTAAVVDDEQQINRAMLVTSARVSFSKGNGQVGVWG